MTPGLGVHRLAATGYGVVRAGWRTPKQAQIFFGMPDFAWQGLHHIFDEVPMLGVIEGVNFDCLIPVVEERTGDRLFEGLIGSQDTCS